MSYELGIPADIRGKLRFPSDGLSGRASSEESVGLEVARQRQP